MRCNVFRTCVLAGAWVLTLVLASSAYAGKVEYPTLYPSPAGEYTDIKSTQDTSLAADQGKVGIGTASPAYTLDVKGNIVNSIPSGGYIALTGDLSGYTVNTYPTLKTNGAIMYFDAWGQYTGNVDSAGFHDVSDEKLKTNITTVHNALEKISQIRGVTFAWKDGRDHQARHMGVLAQEVEKVAPELVSQPQGIREKGVFYGGLNALTIEAIKEQQRALKERRRLIDLLQKEIEELKKR